MVAGFAVAQILASDCGPLRIVRHLQQPQIKPAPAPRLVAPLQFRLK